MLALLIIAFVVLPLVGCTVTLYFASHAPEGYENEMGFYFGALPTNKEESMAAPSARTAGMEDKNEHLAEILPERSPLRNSKEPAGAS